MELELLFREEKKDTISEWDKEVPITVRGKVVTGYLMSEIYEPEVYNELCYTLEYTSADYVRLVMNNGGGQLDSMLSIIDAIKRSNATVVAVLSGTVASAATMIALACDEIEVADHTSWLTHYYSGGSAGKGNEIKAKHLFDEVEIPKMFKEIHKGFFTETEIDRVIDGKDEWLNKEEILKRFANMKDAK
jgi:ATP-dependent protease ClpP protease subunit